MNVLGPRIFIVIKKNSWGYHHQRITQRHLLVKIWLKFVQPLLSSRVKRKKKKTAKLPLKYKTLIAFTCSERRRLMSGHLLFICVACTSENIATHVRQHVCDTCGNVGHADVLWNSGWTDQVTACPRVGLGQCCIVLHRGSETHN